MIERYRKENKKGKEKFSAQTLFQMIEESNSLFGTLGNDGELKNRVWNKDLVHTVRIVGSDCIDYRNCIIGAQKMIQAGVLAGSVTAPILLSGVLTNNPAFCSGFVFAGVPTAAILAGIRMSGLKNEELPKRLRQKNDFFGIKQAEAMKRDLKYSFLNLQLGKDYIDANFENIVAAMAEKEREAREDEVIAKAGLRLSSRNNQKDESIESLTNLQRTQGKSE